MATKVHILKNVDTHGQMLLVSLQSTHLRTPPSCGR